MPHTPSARRTPVTHGARGRSLHLTGFTLTEATYAPGMIVARHEHAWPSWTYVASGSFEETFSTHSEQCGPGVLLSKAGSAAHTNRYGPSGATCLLVEITSGRDLVASGGMRLFDKVMRYDSGGIPGLARRVARAIADPWSAPAIQLECVLLEIAWGMTGAHPKRRVHRQQPAWLCVVRDRLAEEFRNPPSITALSESVAVHKVHLCQAFRLAYGCSPGEFVRQQRLECARRMLTSTRDALSMVAALAGYSDQAHFTRQFRAAVGMTPARFRALYGPATREAAGPFHRSRRIVGDPVCRGKS